MTKFRAVIEGEVVAPPPGHLAHLHHVLSRELRYSLGKSWTIVTMDQLPEDDGRESQDFIQLRIALSVLTGMSQLSCDTIMKAMREDRIRFVDGKTEVVKAT